MRLLACLAITLAAACSDDGTAPTISALTYTPATVTTGQQATITGSMQFDDEDGDLAKLQGDAVLPDGSKARIADASLSGLEQTTGTLPFQLLIVPPQPGVYKFSLWLTDDSGNESNKLDGMLTAQ